MGIEVLSSNFSRILCNKIYFNINVPVAATTLILHQFPKNTPARFPSSAFPRNRICPDGKVAIRQPTAPRPICFSVDLKRGIKFSRMADDVLIESLRATCLDSALNPFSSSVFVFHYWIQSWVLFKPLMVHERIIMINWRGSYWVAGNLRWAEEEEEEEEVVVVMVVVVEEEEKGKEVVDLWEDGEVREGLQEPSWVAKSAKRRRGCEH